MLLEAWDFLNELYNNLSYKGRISKDEFQYGINILLLINSFAGMLIVAHAHISVIYPDIKNAYIYFVWALAIYAIFITYLSGSLLVRRGHDRNKSGWPVFIIQTLVLFLIPSMVYAQTTGNPLHCLFFNISFCHSETYIFILSSFGFAIAPIALLFLYFLTACYTEGAVEGAERFGKSWEEE